MSKRKLTPEERAVLSKAGRKGGKSGSREDKVKAGRKGWRAMLKKQAGQHNGE